MIVVGWKNYGVMTTSLICSNVIYPTSTYEKDFYTTHTEEQTKSFMEEAVRDFNNKCKDADVLDIIIENSNMPVNTLTIREVTIEKLKTMTDDEIKRRILL